MGAFNNAAGGQVTGTGAAGVGGGLLTPTDQGLTQALAQATQVINAQTEATSANTQALAVESQGKSSGGAASVASEAVSTASQFLGGGLSLLPLVSIFTSLFGGGQPQQPAPLVPYSLPPALNLETTTNNQDVTYGETGLPKTGQTPPPSQPASSTPNTTQQITVQIQAMDSQSFLDRSNDIAQAVRQAMLNMNSLNDVVNNL